LQTNKVCEDFANKFNGIDVLFNSAGLLEICQVWLSVKYSQSRYGGFQLTMGPGFLSAKFKDESLESQAKMIHVNFEGVVNMTYAVLKFMKPGSRVVSMASIAAVFGIPTHVVYAATKSAIYHFTEGLSLELYPKGISVTDVSVGYVATPMFVSANFAPKALTWLICCS